jgi:hypothetical protein
MAFSPQAKSKQDTGRVDNDWKIDDLKLALHVMSSRQATALPSTVWLWKTY